MSQTFPMTCPPSPPWQPNEFNESCGVPTDWLDRLRLPARLREFLELLPSS